jgi:hypothetical protein
MVAVLFSHGIGIVKQKHELFLGCFHHWTVLIFHQLPVDVAGVVCIKHMNIHIKQQRSRFIYVVLYFHFAVVQRKMVQFFDTER